MSANLDNIISVTLSIADQAVTQVGFGTPLIYAKTSQSATVKAYSDLPSMVSDGFATTSAAYLAATNIFAQSPRVTQLKIGKRTVDFTQVIKLVPTVKSVSARSGVEVLNQGDFATNTKWAAAGDFAFSGQKAVFTDASHAGTITQSVANQSGTATVGARKYKFVYDVSSSSGTRACTITTGFASAPVTVDVASDGSGKILYFTSAASPADFVLSGTASGGGAFSLDNLSLKLMEQDTFSVEIDGVDLSYVQDAGDVLADVCTGLASAITAGGVAVTGASAGAGTYVTATANVVSKVHAFTDWSSNIAASDVTVDPGIATDLNAILLYDADWYGLVLGSNDDAEVLAAAAWAESNKKLFFADVGGDAVLDPASTTDVLYVLNSDAYTRTVPFVRQGLGAQWAGAGIAGVGLAYVPGSITWAHKQIAGVATEQYTDTQINTIVAKKGNYYMKRFGVGDFLEGWASSGRFIDVTHGADKLVSDIQTGLYTLLVQSLKIPFTDAGIGLVEGVIRNVLNAAVQSGFLAATPAFTVFVPKAKDVSTSDKANRKLTGVLVGATLAGAIHRINIAVTLSL